MATPKNLLVSYASGKNKKAFKYRQEKKRLAKGIVEKQTIKKNKTQCY